jgi:SAM-dependent MidA family methyltransferase
MSAKSPGLNNLLAAEIADAGPLTFARFLELALYHPEFGYYTSGRARIGRKGDFYTNVSVGPAFGRVLADQFGEMWENLGRPGAFGIVEQGANDGALAADILTALPDDCPAEYHIIEPVAVLREAQQAKLEPLGRKVFWHDSLNALPPFTGVHFSNELIDALPFHLLRSTGSSWEELKVAQGEEGFVFQPAPPSLDISVLPPRPSGYVAELRPAAGAWLGELAAKLQAGYILIADYGFSATDLYAHHRTEGTFSCYRAHQRDAKPLETPGEKDITAHVDFTALARTAEGAGLQWEGFTDQHHFLVGAAQNFLHSLTGPPDAARQKQLRELQTLLHPETMGTQFHYLAFSRGVHERRPLSGFRYARTDQKTLLVQP